MFAWLWERHVLGAARKDRVHRAAQGVLVCAAVSWPASERFERKREKISGETEEGSDIGAMVSWRVWAAGTSQVDWKKGKEIWCAKTKLQRT